MSVEILPVVTIVTEGGPVQINKSDYDESVHTIVEDEQDDGQSEEELTKQALAEAEAEAHEEDAKRDSESEDGKEERPAAKKGAANKKAPAAPKAEK